MTQTSKEPSRRVTGTVKPRNSSTGHPVKRERVRVKQGSTITRDQYDAHVIKTMLEDTWRGNIRAMAWDAGFERRYHTYQSDRSDPGYPDDVMAHRSLPRLLFIEAKRQIGVLSFDQVGWLDDLSRMRDSGATCIEVYGAVRPADRDRLVQTLYRGCPAALQTLPGLHQWCLSPECGVCNDERAKAKPSRSLGRGTRRGRARTRTTM